MKSLMQAVKGTKDKSTGVAGLEIKPDDYDKIVRMEPKHPDLHESLALGIDHIIGKDINPRFKKWGGFHASNTNECVRYINYLFNGIEVSPDHTPRVQRIFDTGHDMHARFGRYFERMGIVVAQELPITYDDPPIESTLDLIIDWGGPKVVELKSINEGGFTYRRLYNKPKDDHFRQIQIYAGSAFPFSVMFISAFMTGNTVFIFVDAVFTVFVPDFIPSMFMTSVAGIGSEIIVGVTGIAFRIVIFIKLEIGPM